MARRSTEGRCSGQPLHRLTSVAALAKPNMRAMPNPMFFKIKILLTKLIVLGKKQVLRIETIKKNSNTLYITNDKLFHYS